MKYLLEALGYDIYLLHVMHSVVLTNNIHPGSHHIVDNIAFQHLKQFLLTLRLSLQSTVTPTLSTSFLKEVARSFACIAKGNILP